MLKIKIIICLPNFTEKEISGMISKLDITNMQLIKNIGKHNNLLELIFNHKTILFSINRTGKPYKPNEDKQTKIWTKEMDLIKNNYNIEPGKVIWSMDIKYISTKEGRLYLNAIRDFNSQAIIGYHLLNEMFLNF